MFPLRFCPPTNCLTHLGIYRQVSSAPLSAANFRVPYRVRKEDIMAAHLKPKLVRLPVEGVHVLGSSVAEDHGRTNGSEGEPRAIESA